MSSGLYAGDYPKESQFVPDPNCEANGGVLDGNFCRFLYGERFNIVNDESHQKIYLNFSKETNSLRHDFHLISSKVEVNDNPQSPSYPALPFLSRNIEPGEGGSPFNVPVVWYGRPLGSEFKSPHSPKDIEQFNFNYSLSFLIITSPVTGFLIFSAITLPSTLSDKLTKIFPPSIISEIVTEDLFFWVTF